MQTLFYKFQNFPALLLFSDFLPHCLYVSWLHGSDLGSDIPAILSFTFDLFRFLWVALLTKN